MSFGGWQSVWPLWCWHVKEMNLEPVNYYIPGLCNLSYIAYIVFYTLNKIIALAVGQPYGIIFHLIFQVQYCPSLGDSSVVLTCLRLLHWLGPGLLGLLPWPSLIFAQRECSPMGNHDIPLDKSLVTLDLSS